MLLPPLLAGVAVLCLLLAVAISFGQRAQAGTPLGLPQSTPDEIARQLTVDLEGAPSPADIRRARKPLSERQRLLHAHPYFALYETARQRFGVPRYLVAAVHYQETGFGQAPAALAEQDHWQRHRKAASGLPRPASYPNRSKSHPSVKDDFDVVMALAADLKANGARNLGAAAQRAVAARYGSGADGRLSTAMVVERARAWRLLGTLPLPGSGELATPAEGVVGGCGYFGCPRPGHLHNGVDFLAPTGTPIHAAEAGVVASVESPAESGGYGNFVCIQHRPHLATCYAHMSAFAGAISPGTRVKRGQVIGLVGSTGSSSAPHLHFELRRGPAACSACAVDPLPMLSGDVPSATLPKMARAATAVARPASRTPVPAAPAPAPVPSARALAEGDSGAARPGQQQQADVPSRSRNRPTAGDDAPAAGGSAPGASTPPRTTPAPAPAPAPRAAPAPAPPAQQPAPPPSPPAGQPGTGGAVPAPAAPAPPPPPAATAAPG